MPLQTCHFVHASYSHPLFEVLPIPERHCCPLDGSSAYVQRLCPRTVRACSSQDLKHGHVKLKSTSTCRLMPKPDGGTKPSDDKDVNMALSLSSVCSLRKPGILSTPLALPSIFQFTKKIQAAHTWQKGNTRRTCEPCENVITKLKNLYMNQRGKRGELTRSR